jgi:antagonist of KipI
VSRVKIAFQNAGLQTTLQDFGRSGFQHLGVPSGGAMDRFSAAIANRLVGNPDEAAVFEITLLGPIVEFHGDCQISVAGANLGPVIDGCPAPMWETLTVTQGTKLSFQGRRSGCRCYLAIGGSVESPRWLGSVSPAPPSVVVGQSNSRVVAGRVFEVAANSRPLSKKIYPGKRRPQLPVAGSTVELPIVCGPEWEWFSPEQQRSFLDCEFKIGSQSNRMGYRLSSFWDKAFSLPPMISSGVTPGVVQVATSGRPILLMRDAQTTGGYPRIAVVRYEAINLAGQLAPGDRVRFVI